MVFAIIARTTAVWISSREVDFPFGDSIHHSGTGSNPHDLRTCRNFRQLPNASVPSGGISSATCGGQLPEDLPPLWQRARCLLWVSVGVASIERPIHRRSFESNPAGSAPAHGAPNSVLAMSKQILGNFYLFSHESSSGAVCSSIQTAPADTFTNITGMYLPNTSFARSTVTEQNSIGKPSGRSALRSEPERSITSYTVLMLYQNKR